jgi:hypothetical protein
MNQLTRCNRLIQVRAPEFLAKALDNAADKRLSSRSDYIRAALLDGLRADGIDPSVLAAVRPVRLDDRICRRRTCCAAAGSVWRLNMKITSVNKPTKRCRQWWGTAINGDKSCEWFYEPR